ncbi:hypothetical protein DSO57_1019622 [Entomophthora muscae]|uniref:Uncharacterized protein n=1 Tax=Entomophthora muscae TaxID=34485 RepID=A0ACC2ST54_9FUNG|nr:hypothetical protein DSO57_1019622 [Entomophthora muscae]
MVTDNGSPVMVTIEDTVQDLEAQQEEAHKAISEARFDASKANQNIPISPIWQAALTKTAAHNTSPFFKPANLPRFDRKSNIAMLLWLYQNSMYGADEAMKDAIIIHCLYTETRH